MEKAFAIGILPKFTNELKSSLHTRHLLTITPNLIDTITKNKLKDYQHLLFLKNHYWRLL